MPMFSKTQHIHLVGIGGSGMSGIAEVLLTLGYKVTRLGPAASDTTRRLEELGGRIFIGHQESNVGEAQVVVISSACRPEQPGGCRGQGEADPRHSARRDAGGADAAEIWRGHRRRSRKNHDDVDGGQCAGAGRARPDDGDRRESQCAGEPCPAWARRSARCGSR